MRRLTASALGRRDDERLREELAEHLALLTKEYVRAGLSSDEARRRARLRLGVRWRNPGWGAAGEEGRVARTDESGCGAPPTRASECRTGGARLRRRADRGRARLAASLRCRAARASLRFPSNGNRCEVP
jgi:hypothetical protein